MDIIYSNSNYSIQQIEIIEPYEIQDEYIPNRHNVIFKELIFSPETIYCSLSIELMNSNHKTIEEENKVIQEEKSSENEEIMNK